MSDTSDSSLDNPTTPGEEIARYLNAQLGENHAAATNRFALLEELEGDPGNHKDRKNLYAWARYRYTKEGQDGDRVVDLFFSEPELTLICAHNALLKIVIKDIRPRPEDIQSPLTEGNLIEVFYRIEIACRSPVPGDVDGNRTGMCLLDCNFSDAPIVNPTQVPNPVQGYLSSYLDTLRKGHHHLLFTPFKFLESDQGLDDHIPLPSKDPKSSLSIVHSYTADMINDHLSVLWRVGDYYITGQRQETDTSPVLNSSSSLAGCNSWIFPDSNLEGWRVALRFGKPTVHLFCTHEVVLQFTLAEVRFYGPEDDEMDTQRDPDYRDWRIRLAVEISPTRKGIRIVPKSARLSRAALDLNGSDVREEHSPAYRNFLRFFVENYFKGMAAERLTFIVRPIPDIEPPPSEREDREPPSSTPPVVPTPPPTQIPHLTIKDTKMNEFDVVIAVSETSINDQISRIFAKSTMRQPEDSSSPVTPEDSSGPVQPEDSSSPVSIEITKVTVSLDPTNNDLSQDGSLPTASPVVISRAILTLHVNLMGSTDSRGCRVTFEVEVKIDSDSDHRQSDGLRPRQEHETRNIYLDLQHALIAPQHSLRVDEYNDSNKVTAHLDLSYKIQRHYFPQFIDCGMHILASVPLYTAEPNFPPSFYRLTSMSCLMFAAETPLDEATMENSTDSDQILFVLGMIGGKPLPSISSFEPSALWLDRGRHGTLAISKRAFNETLLPPLGNVNALTTFVPATGNHSSSASAINLLQWAKHPDLGETLCEWIPSDPENSNPPQSRFEWNWADEWTMLRYGSLSSMAVEEKICCETQNTLTLPDTSAPPGNPLKITMSGRVTLEISSRPLLGSNPWQDKASLDWSGVISIKSSTRSNGVEVDVNLDTLRPEPHEPTEESIGPRNGKFPDIHAKLNEQLLQMRDLQGVLRVLRRLEGQCDVYYPGSHPQESSRFTLSTPISNLEGDILFELQLPHLDTTQHYI